MEKTNEPTPYSAMKQTIDALQETTSLIKGKTPKSKTTSFSLTFSRLSLL